MKSKTRLFEQYLSHDNQDEDKWEEYIINSISQIGLIVMYFNGLERSLDDMICEIFTDRTDSTGLIVLHKMSYSTKVDLFKRFSDDFHFSCNCKIEGYEVLIKNLKEAGKLRNLVVHADWESTDEEGYTYVNLKIRVDGMEQEYIQFSEESLSDIIELINKTRHQLGAYWEQRGIALNTP